MAQQKPHLDPSGCASACGKSQAASGKVACLIDSIFSSRPFRLSQFRILADFLLALLPSGACRWQMTSAGILQCWSSGCSSWGPTMVHSLSMMGERLGEQAKPGTIVLHSGPAGSVCCGQAWIITQLHVSLVSCHAAPKRQIPQEYPRCSEFKEQRVRFRDMLSCDALA